MKALFSFMALSICLFSSMSRSAENSASVNGRYLWTSDFQITSVDCSLQAQQINQGNCLVHASPSSSSTYVSRSLTIQASREVASLYSNSEIPSLPRNGLIFVVKTVRGARLTDVLLDPAKINDSYVEKMLEAGELVEIRDDRFRVISKKINSENVEPLFEEIKKFNAEFRR